MTDESPLSLVGLRAAISEGRIDPAGFVSAQRTIAESVGASLNAFTEIIDDPVRRSGPLVGIPIAVKDAFVDRGRAPTMGSLVHAPGMSGTAEVLTQLRTAGATILGYTNLHEWAIGTTSVVTATGPVLNPWNLERIAGGSSGGSAAAVAAGIVPAAIGTDASGSVRIPAACCGVVGLKSSFGRISLRGEAAGSSRLNAAGVIARTVEDAGFLFGLLAERAPRTVDVSGLTAGVPSNFFFEDVQPEVREIVERGIRALEGTLDVVAVAMSGVENAGTLASRSFLPHVAKLVEADMGERPDDFQQSTLKALWLGLQLRQEPEVDATPVHEAWSRAFETCDVVVTPTLPALTPRIDQPTVKLPSGEQSADLKQIAFNAPMNVAGVPAIAIPCGEVDGLPVSMTLSARHGAEDVLVSVGRALEDVLDRSYSGRVAPASDPSAGA